MAQIKKFENATSVFAGQGDLIMFDRIEDYNATGFGFNSLVNPKSLGQIVQDSTTFEGEDPETNSILDEQGNTITATTTAGTIGFSFDIASTSPAMIQEFLMGSEIETEDITADWIDTISNAVGFGVELPTQTRPLMVLNDEKTKAFLYPKSKIVANITNDEGLYRIHCTVTCEYLDTAQLKTAMVFNAKEFKYDNAAD